MIKVNITFISNYSILSFVANKILTKHPRAHLANVSTLPASGAEPTTMMRSLPPMPSRTLRNTNLSQIESPRTIPLSYNTF